MKTLMIYGATGYTGRMAVHHAKAAALELILAGRSADRLTDAAFSVGDLSELPQGPNEEQRLAHRAFAVAEGVGVDGSMARSMIERGNGYSYTPLAAVEAARRVLGGERRVGFETPAHLFGVGFAATIVGTTITDF